MLWTYARGAQSLRLETRFDNDAQEFVLIIHSQGDSQPRVERFKGTASFRQRLAELESELELEQWLLHGPPALLRDGWKI